LQSLVEAAKPFGTFYGTLRLWTCHLEAAKAVIMIRLVLDTATVVHALRSRNGASNRILMAVAEHRVLALASVPLFVEWEAVIKRPEHRLVHGLDLEQLDTVMADLAILIKPVQLHFLWRPQLRDPGDEMVLETAANGRADGIVTWNVRNLAAGSARFGIPVVSPQDALKRWSL
jgi:putative PIN family toxin of toxin-antitoxin system